MENILTQEQPKSNTEAPPILCVCCDNPATAPLGDWDVCDVCYNILVAPWPAEIPVNGYAPESDEDKDDYGLESWL